MITKAIWILVISIAVIILFRHIFREVQTNRALNDLGIDMIELQKRYSIEDWAEREQMVNDLIANKLKEKIILNIWKAERRFREAKEIIEEVGDAIKNKAEIVSFLDGAIENMSDLRDFMCSIDVEEKKVYVKIHVGLFRVWARKDVLDKNRRMADFTGTLNEIQSTLLELKKFQILGEMVGVLIKVDSRIRVKIIP